VLYFNLNVKFEQQVADSVFDRHRGHMDVRIHFVPIPESTCCNNGESFRSTLPKIVSIFSTPHFNRELDAMHAARIFNQ